MDRENEQRKPFLSNGAAPFGPNSSVAGSISSTSKSPPPRIATGIALPANGLIGAEPTHRRGSSSSGYDLDFGARPMARTIQVELKDRIVDDLLFGALAGGGIVRVGVDPETDRLKFTSESRKASAEPAGREREPA